MLGQVHGNLPRIDDRTRIVLGFDLDQSQAELLGHHLLDGFDGDLARLRVDKILEHLLRVRQRDLSADQGGMSNQTDQRSFQFANVRADVRGDVESDVGGQCDLLLLGFLLKNRDFGFEIGRLDVGDQSPLEAAAQAVFDLGELLGRAVAGDDDLLHRLVQRVEGVEELFLGALLAGRGTGCRR